jgi:hypothetical protein
LDLLVAIADEIKTYRADEIEVRTPDHVDRWVSQFTPAMSYTATRKGHAVQAA